MKSKMKPRLLSIGLTLLAIVMLASCSKKPEESASSTSSTPSAIEQTPSSGNATTSTPPKAEESTSSTPSTPSAIEQTPSSGNAGTSSTKKRPSPANKTATLAEAEKLGVKPQGETTCPSEAPVKGKITRNRGNIYHVAKSTNYDQTKPDICFKDEATAEKAGFRAPK
jgi:cytoskeletal protein RodZ